MTTTTEQLKDLLDRASDGPWRVSYERGSTQIRTAQNEIIMCDETFYPWVPEHEADWDIIALAPTLAAEVVRLRAIIEKVDQYTPVADSTCDEPGITFTEAIMRQWPELRPPSP